MLSQKEKDRGNLMRIFWLIVFVFGLTACATQVKTPHELWHSGQLPIATQLVDNPRIKQGQLANGLTYYLVENQTPKNEIAVRLHINVGSLDEADNELGLAHLLEHMAFNGSTNVPEGEMVAILERYGLSFGADTNASTSFHETQYKLDLPTNSEAIIDTALYLMRETASNLTISATALAAEIPVVLAEYDARNTLAFQAQQKQFNQYTQGMRYAQRWAIGTKDTLRAMTAAQLKDFYARYYTPANSTLIIVGDFDAQNMQAKIESNFADWSNESQRPDTLVGELSMPGEPVFVVHQAPGLPTQVMITLSQMSESKGDSVAQRRDEYLKLIANSILNYRLASKLLTGKASFENAYHAQFNLFERADISLSLVSTSPDRWRDALSELVVEILKIQEFGVSWDEADRQITSIRNGLYTVASEADTLDTARITQALLESLDDERAILSPQAELKLFEELMQTFTLDEINQVMIDQFSAVEPTIFVQSDASAEITQEDIKTAFNAALDLEIVPDEFAVTKAFAYTDFGQDGEVVLREYDEVYDITTVMFDNGLRLNVKPTKLVTGQVEFDLRYGTGYQFFTEKDSGLKELYNYMVAAGLGQHNVNELRELLSDKDVSLRFVPRFNTWGGRFNASNEHLLLQLQLMAAFVSDAAWDPALENLYRQNTQQQYQQAKSSVNAVRSFELQNLLYANDVRVSTPELPVALSRTFAELNAERQEQLADGPMTLSIVGDVDVEEVINFVAQTFGALAYDFTPPQKRKVTDLRLDTPGQYRLTHQGNPQNALAIRVYHTADNSDKKRNNTLNILREVLSLKVTQKLREELGAAYSPGVFNTQSRYVVDDGYIQFDTQTSPEQLGQVMQAYDEIVAEIKSEDGISDDELSRAVEPLVAGINQALEQNGFWLNRLGLLHTEPNAVDRWFDLEDLIRSITVEDVRRAANQYLIEDRMINVEVIHESLQ
jgi:zinc protease